MIKLKKLISEQKTISVSTNMVTRNINKRENKIVDDLFKKMKSSGWKNTSGYDEQSIKSFLRQGYNDAMKEWNSSKGDTIILTIKDNSVIFSPQNFKFEHKIKESLLKEMWENITFNVVVSAWNEEKEGLKSTPMVQFSINDATGKTLVAPRVYEIKKDFSKFLSDVQKEIGKIVKK